MHTFIKKNKQVNKQTDNVNKQIAAASTTTTTASTTRKLTHAHFAPLRVKPFARKKKVPTQPESNNSHRTYLISRLRPNHSREREHSGRYLLCNKLKTMSLK